jgi:radical SAM superfamily enzyme YgiQ (UPF0313 family)
MTTRKPRILFIQHEIYKWQQAKMWSYNLHLAYEAGFRANGIEFFTLATPWVPRGRELLNGMTFDQVWINDIAHSSKPGGLGGYKLTAADWEWIAGLAPVRLGFITESVEYSEEEHAANAMLGDTKRALETTLNHVTHVAAVDEHDFPLLRSMRDLPVFWLVPPMPLSLINSAVTLPPKAKATFIGTPYGERAAWLELPVLRDWLEKQTSPDNFTSFPGIFDWLHAGVPAQLQDAEFPVAEFYQRYIEALRTIHYRTFCLYLDGLRAGSAVVHLPSYCKVYNSRVYEGMAAGRPVITSKVTDRPRLDTLFRDGQDILLYDADDPGMIVRHIQHIVEEPEFGLRVAAKAREKMLRFHTMENRVAELLTWIETAEEPRYETDEAAPAAAQHDSQPVWTAFLEAPRQTPKAAEPVAAAIEKAPQPPQPAPAAASPEPPCPLPKEADPVPGTEEKPSRTPQPAPAAVRRPGKLRVLFISPPYARLLGLGNCRFPLSFGPMATMLSMNGHTAAIYDADFDRNLIGKTDTYEGSFGSQGRIAEALKNREHCVWKEIEQQIRGFRPDVVGITTMTSKFPMAVRVAEIAKSFDPRIRIVIGGHHSSIFGPKLVQDKNIDFAVIGEGEMTLLELVNRLSEQRPDVSKIRGLAYKNGKGVVVTEPRELLGNLDVLPIADRDLIINDGFVTENNIMTSRGCPFNCSYCGAQVIWKRKVRRRSVQNVIREIGYLFSRSASRNVNFWDDSFTSDRTYVKEMTDELRKFDGLRFSCITRLDLVEQDTLARLKEAGCSMILFGIESGNDDILKLIDKKMTRELIRRKTGMVDAAGIPWLGFFIMGYPGETRENILQTLAFMKELNPSFAEINIFNPLPGTKIWNDLEQQGKVSSDMDFSKYSQASTENFFTNGSMTREEFREFALSVAREFDTHNRSRNGNH